MADFKAKKELTQEILAELACSTCQDVPGPSGARKNRYFCSNGHMVCEGCRSQECSCKSKTFSGPVSHVEKILDKLQWHHCGHFKHGCRDVIEAKNLDEHEKTCIFREINCPDSSCEKQVLFKDIHEHVSNDHKVWALNLATKIDGKTFKVMYSGFIVGARPLNEGSKTGKISNVRDLLKTPSRFQNKHGIGWSSAGSDAICFTVDRNISIMGCCTFGCQGSATYDLDFYDCSDEKNPRSLQKLNCTLNPNDCVDGIVQLKFAKGIPVKKNVKYGLVCRTSEYLSAYGSEGRTTVNGPDGTKFSFSTSTYHGLNRTTIERGQLPQILYGTETGKQIQQLPFDEKNCGTQVFGSPVKLETADGMTFYMVGRKQCDTLRFWIYIVGSSLEAKHYSYTLTVKNNTGGKKYIHEGQVFTLDSDEVAEGSVFIMTTEAAQKICEEDTNLKVNVVIRNLKEEAKDDSGESGVDDGED